MGLIKMEDEMEHIERRAALQKVFKKRSDYIQKIDRFWHIVFSQHPEFAEFVNADDFKYLELIRDVYIKWDAAESSDYSVDPGSFSITFKFNRSEDGDFEQQDITKSFSVEKIDGSVTKRYDDEDEIEESEKLVSSNCAIQWPKTYDGINPSLIKDKKTTQGKKNYRTGMKSFFGWFRWTGRKPGKEFPNGDDFAKLLSDDIFPNAVKYYTEAQRDGLDEEIDSDASEPLDLSDAENQDVDTSSRGLKRKFGDE
ncbi:hypothetical protein WICPIJ_004991 [Wickerhamomyces pijperi]|uniref:Vacuolar protein sorting-associated protein 75 n=1 Tax=Wickerhamomyces pijperi TaxID=599730 RepID=A0A9P8TMC6_WICPI|nr:hypothetical protein WICPIJ_004991 [Wickerhamomyces pijperi]